jgi:hypothetical protein
MSTDHEVCWGVRWPRDFGQFTAFGPFATEEEAFSYAHSERFANIDCDPEDTWVLRFTGTKPVQIRCQAGLEWTRDTLPRWRDPDTGKLEYERGIGPECYSHIAPDLRAFLDRHGVAA